ncbi:uncharacterized protein LOC132743387 [Ruditapes philippinarum]|uniref:uncharacterized protein LOC132743387 n=1 Tax=Ruditapes philippinarum TaxID=129788 RepID=UPI00295AD400|nr:uncharacterized protein LOC132743387 [Ruditapes philippinarum]
MARKNKSTRNAKPKATHKSPEKPVSENLQDKQRGNMPRRRATNSLSRDIEKKKDTNENDAAHVVGTVVGIIGGTFAGILVMQAMMFIYGPIFGSFAGAGTAGLFGVAIQSVLSKHVQLLNVILLVLGLLLLPLLIYLVFGAATGASTFDYVRENNEPRSIVNLE